MILELDIGNTRVKWRRLTADGGVDGRGACSLEDLVNSAAATGAGAGFRLRASCVRGNDVESRVADWARAAGAYEVRFARTLMRAAGVTVAYADPARLGADRWLAMLAAYSAERGAVCVIQCGSAITVDLVDAGGQHLGGLIAPGIRLMERSLLADTEAVRFTPDAVDPFDASPGRDTAACVRSGVANAAAGLIERVFANWHTAVPAARAVIGGGDAERIAPLLAIDARHSPELVLDGLALVLP